jgi:hypothetical protein
MVRAKNSHAKQMRTSMADLILHLKTLPKGGETHNSSEEICKGEVPKFKHPLDVFTTVQSAHDDIGELLAHPQVKEEDVENLVVVHSSTLSKVIPIRERHLWDWEWTRLCLKDLYSGVTCILSEELFNEGIVPEMQTRECQAKETCRSTEERLRVQLPRIARLHMSTIGSSHKLPVAKDENVEFIDAMGGLKMDDDGNVGHRDVPDTVVVFDESDVFLRMNFLACLIYGGTLKVCFLWATRNSCLHMIPHRVGGRLPMLLQGILVALPGAMVDWRGNLPSIIQRKSNVFLM